MIELERVDGQWYEIAGDTTKLTDTDSVVKKIKDCYVIPDLRFYSLQNGDIVTISKEIVKTKLRIGDRWEQYPYMTCVSKIYKPHKWWQFWKWHKLVGYEMRYYKE